jgi:hypothetical protein
MSITVTIGQDRKKVSTDIDDIHLLVNQKTNELIYVCMMDSTDAYYATALGFRNQQFHDIFKQLFRVSLPKEDISEFPGIFLPAYLGEFILDIETFFFIQCQLSKDVHSYIIE